MFSALLLCAVFSTHNAAAQGTPVAGSPTGADVFAVANAQNGKSPTSVYGWGPTCSGGWDCSCLGWVNLTVRKAGLQSWGASCAVDAMKHLMADCPGFGQKNGAASNANVSCPLKKMSEVTPQPGDIIFWAKCSNNQYNCDYGYGPAGHVAISAGGNKMLTTGWAHGIVSLQTIGPNTCNGDPYVLSLNGGGGEGSACTPSDTAVPDDNNSSDPHAIVSGDHDAGQKTCADGGNCSAGNGCGSTPQCTGSFFNALAQAEAGNNYATCNSAGCCGKIQFCSSGWWSSSSVCGSLAAFKVNANNCQDQEIIAYTKGNWNTIASYGGAALLGKSITINGQQYTITQAGLLGAANLCGGYGAYRWAAALVNGSGGGDSSDSNGTTCSKYFTHFNSTYMPPGLDWADNTGYSGASSCEASHPHYPCGDPALTGWFANNPCELPPPPSNPGQKFQDMLKDWWDKLRAALKDLTTQLSAQTITQIAQRGQQLDADSLAVATRLQEEIRANAQRDTYPADAVCTVASAARPLNNAADVARQLAGGFKTDMRKRSNSAAASENLNVYQEYCATFRDDKSDAACPANLRPTIDDALKNADVRVETFLFKDTINMANPQEYAASKALLRNLVTPFSSEAISDTALKTNTGQEYVLRRQRLEAVYNLARDVVASIISRRAAIPRIQKGKDANNNDVEIDNGPAAKEIQDIRVNAGTLPPERQATINTPPMPSYNEIMQVLTKERFLDPKYFVNLRSNPGALKQEQAGIDTLTTVLMQDIYKMQEQINALLAARAALKIKDFDNVGTTGAAPAQTR